MTVPCLGERRLRALRQTTGLNLLLVCRLDGGPIAEGVTVDADGCHHYAINLTTGEFHSAEPAHHWTGCSPAQSRGFLHRKRLGLDPKRLP